MKQNAWIFLKSFYSSSKMLQPKVYFWLKGFVGVVFQFAVHCIRVTSWQIHKRVEVWTWTSTTLLFWARPTPSPKTFPAGFETKKVIGCFSSPGSQWISSTQISTVVFEIIFLLLLGINFCFFMLSPEWSGVNDKSACLIFVFEIGELYGSNLIVPI